MRGYLTAVWRAMRYMAVFCQVLLDFIKEIRNVVQDKHRADMCGN